MSARPTRERFRLTTVLATAAAMLLGGVVWAGPASSDVGVPTTYMGHTYASTKAPSQDKPQSKLWFHDATWWALMVEAGGTRVFIHELLDDHTWRNTGVLVDGRAESTGDALWSSKHGKLYVASRVTGTSNLEVSSFSYNSSTRSWALVSRTPVNSGGGSESATIDQDSTGRLWVTYTRAARVWVAYSDASGGNWVAGFQPPVPDTVIASDDLSSVVAFGGNSVGVLYSDQESGGFHFAIHNDGDPVDVWRSEDVLKAPGMSDDHINLKQLAGDTAGRVFAAIKTSKGDLSTDSSSDPLVGVLTRTGPTNGTGSWAFAPAGTVADDHSRPLIMIDKANQELYFFATAPVSGGDIFYKKAPLSNISFGTGRGTPFVNATPLVNNASGAKDAVDGASGMVIMAVAHGKKQYVHAEMALTAGGRFDGGGGDGGGGDGGGGTDPAPTVTAMSPGSTATGVPIGTNVTATFSEDVQGVSTTTFTLKNAGTGAAVSASVGYDAGTDVATLNPGGDLLAGTTYTATLTGGPSAIRDLSEQPLETRSWSFTTATASGNTGAPFVKTMYPASGATKIGLAANVSATFSEAVQGVSTGTFTVAPRDGGAAVPATVTQYKTTNKWILNPGSNLSPDTWYRATLTGGSDAIRDLGNTPLVTTSWDFLTGPPPRLSSRAPSPGATGVSRTTSVTATFNELVQGVGGSTYTLKDPSGATVTAVVSQSSSNPKTWILDPGVSSLQANAKYTVTMTGGLEAVRDLAGNPFTTLSWTFTTGP